MSLGIILTLTISFTPAFSLTELERATISDPRLVSAFGSSIGNNVNVDQQFQISADIINQQEKSQKFVYLVQIKDDTNTVISLGWISGQLTPDQKLNPSLSWTPTTAGEFVAEIFVWEGLVNHGALTKQVSVQINVS